MIHLFPSRQHGYVAAGTGVDRRLFLSREDKTSLAQRKQCVSLLAMVSNVSLINTLLPLVLLANQTYVSAEEMTRLTERYELDDHCWLLRLESSWNDNMIMVWLLEVLRKCLRDVMSQYTIGLLIDCCSCHIADTVITKAGRCGFRLLYIPAGMTATLQPLDCYVFARFKKAVLAAFHHLRGEAEDGRVRTELYIREIMEIGKHLLFEEEWTWAFNKCGFDGKQRQLAATMRKIIPGIEPQEQIPADLPTLHDLQTIFPKGKKIPIGWLFHWTTKVHEQEEQSPVVRLPQAGPAVHVSPWFGRLRSSSSLSPLGSKPELSGSVASSSSHPWRPTAKTRGSAVPKPKLQRKREDNSQQQK